VLAPLVAAAVALSAALGKVGPTVSLSLGPHN
jgi:hypothetical protein